MPRSGRRTRRKSRMKLSQGSRPKSSTSRWHCRPHRRPRTQADRQTIERVEECTSSSTPRSHVLRHAFPSTARVTFLGTAPSSAFRVLQRYSTCSRRFETAVREPRRGPGDHAQPACGISLRSMAARKSEAFPTFLPGVSALVLESIYILYLWCTRRASSPGDSRDLATELVPSCQYCSRSGFGLRRRHFAIIYYLANKCYYISAVHWPLLVVTRYGLP